MKKLLYWIDDTHDQRTHVPAGASKVRIEKQLKVTLKIPPIATHVAFSDQLEAMDAGNTVGVLMDYQLTKVGANRQVEYGTTWAAQLRSVHPSIPIVGLSAKREQDIPKFRIENFIAFFPRNDLLGVTPPLAALRAIFDGYRDIWKEWEANKGQDGIARMIGLLKPPSEVVDLMRMAIPEQLRGAWDGETPHIASRWIWHQLQGVPGFLFDDLEVATHLGITADAFRKVSKRFEKARFRGPLACDARPRWWISLIRGSVEEIIKKCIVGPICQSRIRLLSALRVPVSGHKSCLAVPHGRAKSDEAPECVAFRSQEWIVADRVPAMLDDTIVDEADANPPFGFQSRRHFRLNAGV